MTKKEQQVANLTDDIDYAPLTVQLSLADRRTLANSLLKLGYRNMSELLKPINETQQIVKAFIRTKKDSEQSVNYFEGYCKALELIKDIIKGDGNI